MYYMYLVLSFKLCAILIFDIQIQILAFLKERSEDKSFRFVLDNSLIFIELFDTIPNILFSFAPEKDKVKNKIHLHSQVLGMPSSLRGFYLENVPLYVCLL